MKSPSTSFSFTSLDEETSHRWGNVRKHWRYIMGGIVLVLVGGALGAAVTLASVSSSHHSNPSSNSNTGGLPPPPTTCAPRHRPDPNHPNIKPYLTSLQFPASADDFSRPLVLHDVTVVDPSSSSRKEHQVVVVEGTQISAVGDLADLDKLLDGRTDYAKVPCGGRFTVAPGFIGMHEHLFHTSSGRASPFLPGDPPVPNKVEASDTGAGSSHPMDGAGYLNDMFYTAPKMYLAAGVTTARTAGAVDAWADLNLARDIDAGIEVGPRILPTAPYIASGTFLQMQRVRGAKDAADTVRSWRRKGFTNFKLYMNLTVDESKAAVETANELGCKTTAHIHRMSATQAVAEAGLKNLEHGLGVFSERGEIFQQGLDGKVAQNLLQLFLDHDVTLTSTLSAFINSGLPRSAAPYGVLSTFEREAMPNNFASFVDWVDQGWRNLTSVPLDAQLLERLSRMYGMFVEFDQRYFKKGGRLMFGCDPTGSGTTLPGFGDHQALKLLASNPKTIGSVAESAAGKYQLTSLEVLQVASSNAAEYLGEEACLGGVRVGMNADLVVLPGDPTGQGGDIGVALDGLLERGYVIKDGLMYDPRKLLAAVKHVGAEI